MRTFLSFSVLLMSIHASAQNAAPNWLESTLYGGGKINAVVAVVAVIILGIGVWMWRMDKRIMNIEKTKKP